MVGLVVPAAGRGSRFDSAENKIWARIGDRTVLDWTLSAFQAHEQIDTIILVGAAVELPRLRETAVSYSKVFAVVAGGATRQESVGNGLKALPEICDIALVHDAARPGISAGLISKVIEGIHAHGAALPGLPISDTVKRVAEGGEITETVPRSGLWTVQTPQGARLAYLLEAYKMLGPGVAAATDEASILEAAGYPVHVVEGEAANLKVTRPGDIERAAAALGVDLASEKPEPAFEIRTGFGYDVHSFAEGRTLWLGGVQIPYGRGLSGHSDADVLLHAVCDALLGAASMGDIGVLFPDTDAAHKDRPSIEFVQEVRRRLDTEGWRISNVDVALLAEEPRIGPYRERMTAVIADGLMIAPTQINLKATTSEKMGFVGRKEGMACWAVATLTRS
jgi:2-C-methyl-D-erythritol 4-phosphate cytidylyltransferase/2-C-methyl-D-erythritol 2,4-cyclodiphosphate synthase